MVEFYVKARMTPRGVACKVSMCLGISAQAWNECDEGSPFWDKADQKFHLGVGNNWWLRKIGEDENGVKYRLDGRYTGTPGRQEAMEHLVKWLESDLMFGR
jgi:hypothetical protein